MFTEQNTYKHSRVCSTLGNLTAMYSFNCCFIPVDQTKRPAFKTCIIHCSYDKSRLISHSLKKRSRLFEIFIEGDYIHTYIRTLLTFPLEAFQRQYNNNLKVMGHCFIHWQRIPRKEKFPKSYITGNAVVFLA